MRIAVRDDDTCFYTRPEELEQAFGNLEDFPVTLSVVPFTVWEHAGTYPYGMHPGRTGYAPLEENAALVAYLKERILAGRYSIALHGIHHEYRCNALGDWEPETAWMDADSLQKELAHARAYLEQVLDTSVSVFAAPSNAVSQKCASALDVLGLHVNCNYCKRFERELSLPYLKNYLKSNLFRLLTGTRYCGILQERNHKEMALFEFVSEERLKKQLEWCMKTGTDLVIYTHYWDLNQNPEKKAELVRFLTHAREQGAIPSHLSECFL